jgi:Zn finger protein HypA/HybF involved in hydrogenase expression
MDLPLFVCEGCGAPAEVAGGDEFEVESIEVEEAACIAPR